MNTFSKLAFVALAFGITVLPTAQERAPQVQLTIAASAKDGKQDRNVLVSVIRSGEIVAQNEWVLNIIKTVELPAGSYHIKMEGEGLVTQKKGPYQAIAGRSSVVNFSLEPGVGSKVVHYGEGPLSREEVATRIKKLEDAVAKLQKGGGL